MKGLLKFLSASIVTQATAAMTGLLLAHWLMVDDYAIYTVMTMMTGAVMVLTKGGVNLGLNAILGRVWPDKQKAQQALKASLIVRRKIAIILLPMILFFSSWLLFENGADILTMLMMALFLVIYYIFDFQSKLHEQIIFFDNSAHKVQLIDGTLSLFRLVCILALKFIGFLNVSLAILVGVLTAGLRIFPIRKAVAKIIPQHRATPVTHGDIDEVKRIAHRQLSLDIFMVIQAQAVLFVIAYYGDYSDTAAFGALTRIGQLFLPVTAFITAYAVPRFCQVSHQRLVRDLMLWTGLVFGIGMMLVLLSATYPELLLFLVGDNYASYTYELLISCIYVAFNAACYCFWTLLANRGLNKYSYVQLITFPFWCLIAPLVFDLSTLSGALAFQFGIPVTLLMAALMDLKKEMFSGVAMKSRH
ncbi:lipopolysaccharide biosynthesis protein [Photobacterium atrarenae]|uniref:Polysaccharide biosynthesis protein n=1 Tax=Photobacterium atrarenae TaxID=865757 RepID=A0ABY5GM99_9GAMM|nr:hypothetical protein [Photobacterium atrarenae]UTV30458.1 hypothetical protein NNL38_17940 [Photobacterium atrarenae]